MPLRERLLQDALQRIGPDGHLGDLSVLQELLEVAVGDGLDRGLTGDIWEQEGHQHCDCGIPEQDLAFAGFRVHDDTAEKMASSVKYCLQPRLCALICRKGANFGRT